MLNFYKHLKSAPFHSSIHDPLISNHFIIFGYSSHLHYLERKVKVEVNSIVSSLDLCSVVVGLSIRDNSLLSITFLPHSNNFHLNSAIKLFSFHFFPICLKESLRSVFKFAISLMRTFTYLIVLLFRCRWPGRLRANQMSERARGTASSC